MILARLADEETWNEVTGKRVSVLGPEGVVCACRAGPQPAGSAWRKPGALAQGWLPADAVPQARESCRGLDTALAVSPEDSA